MREKNIHYLIVFTDNLFSKKSQIGMQITSLAGIGHKKALAERAVGVIFYLKVNTIGSIKYIYE